jgi:hypothetical protein
MANGFACLCECLPPLAGFAAGLQDLHQGFRAAA